MPSTCGIQLENSSRTVFQQWQKPDPCHRKERSFLLEADTVFSQSSQSTEPEKEISIRLDENEQQ